MKLKAQITALSIALLGLTACEQATPIVENTVDLTEYGVPVSIKVLGQDSIVKGSSSLIQEIKIYSKDAPYYIEVHGVDASTTDLKQLKEETLADIKERSDFNRIVSEDEAGFIYESQYDGDSTKFFNFRYLTLKGDKAFTFQTSTMQEKQFNLQEVEKMYQCVNVQ